MTGYRITARALQQQLVSDEVLRELKGLEECGEVEERGMSTKSGKVVFVLEDEDRERADAPKLGR